MCIIKNMYKLYVRGIKTKIYDSPWYKLYVAPVCNQSPFYHLFANISNETYRA